MVGLTGLQTFGGGGSAPSNALANTPFNSTSSMAGTGVGNLGQFGGYIPTPLPQFNNYADYLSSMPGAQQMDKYAEMGLAPGTYGWDLAGYRQLAGDVYNNAWAEVARTGAENASEAAIGPRGSKGGFIYNNWYPEAQNWYGQERYLQNTLAPSVEQMMPEFQQQIPYLQGLEDPIKQQAFDPQSALYARTAQQLQDQTRAGLEARGIDMTPYGAGVEGSTLSNFNIDWQNAQLQRELQGAQGISGLAGAAAGQGQTAAELAGAGAGLRSLGQQFGQSAVNLQDLAGREEAYFSRLPYDTRDEILKNEMNTMERVGQYGTEAAKPYQQAFQNWQDIQNQFLAANQQSFNQNQISGFEDPFSMLQLQSQIEMEREQMQQQEEMQKKQMAMQGAGMGMSALGGMKGGI